ncbi:hypothetical protein ETAA8_04630 [Anatilimnocola aggregata]|uniref:Uncharacterized protein n=1 Tax=Anatilimnocola aggregata TaxID=2528021 RepID=A0A517Y591_9BACT|nr:PmoA family protein [Anatilimnocola aggregata]QDU25395.1 hypothetical protein ETAA8_04630 [Anatilimnocola aggregata]
MLTQVFLLTSLLGQVTAETKAAEKVIPAPKPVPAVQVFPLPDSQAAVEHDGREISRYYFGPGNRRTFVYPLIGPSGKSHTRMGHPRDPNGHSHHNSLWISHHDVNGVGFWNDQTKGRIVHKRVSRYEDADSEALIEVENTWVDEAGKKLLEETRAMRFIPSATPGEWLLVIDLNLTPGADAKEGVTFGKTPFGITGIRLAKTIGVHDGGGRILNSEGGVNEAGVFWKQARWVDYSGPLTKTESGGVTLFDHPMNPSHPSHFHVRDDGWMGACLSYEAPRTIAVGDSLKLRYGYWVHGGTPTADRINEQFVAFAKIGDVPAIEKKPKP